MASPNLRFLALRPRLAPLLAALRDGDDDATAADALLREIYRAIAHFTVLAIYRDAADALTVIASRGPLEHHTLAHAQGTPGAALSTPDLIAVPKREADPRHLPTQRPFAAELSIALPRPGRATLVLHALLEEPAALGFADRELFEWIQRTITNP